MFEINFDGLVGPSHNYAGLSLGNIASASHAGSTSRPRAAAIEGIAKMRRLIALGIPQGFLLPHDRPDATWLRRLGFTGDDAQVCAAAWRESPALFRNAFSASAMWTANAATVSPAPDTGDGRSHLSVANLSSMVHRSLEPEQTARQLRLIFGDQRYFAVHDPLPAPFGDEGAANVMRLANHHGARGVEIFVYGEKRGSGFPARQSRTASQSVARRHGLDPRDTHFVRQSDAAIEAGAFHNDVVAVANETVLFAHERAFDDKADLYDFIQSRVTDAHIIEVPAARVSLSDAIGTYLFNSQLVTLPDGRMTLIVPGECRDNENVWGWLTELTAGNGPISRVEVIEVRESMQNGGGPACLRLRVAVDQAALGAIDPRFLLDEAGCDALEHLVQTHWPERIAPADLGNPDLWRECRAARAALLRHLRLDDA
jgi:succinylarginine dihydrolase